MKLTPYFRNAINHVHNLYGPLLFVNTLTVTLLLTLLNTPMPSFATEKKLQIVTSIKPIHSLVANVMQGVGKAKLLLTGTSTPHGFSLKPSQSVTLQEADLIFWIGPSLEASLKKPIGTIGANALSIELEHVNEEEGHEEHDQKHGEQKHDKQEHHDDHHEGHEEAHNGNHHDEHDHEEHGHNPNAHLWLNPDNAILMVHKIADILSKADPKNTEVFSKNAQSTILRINDLNKHLEATLKPINKNGYILFHDAYRSFEQRFGFQSAGIISINPEARLSAARIVELQKIVDQQKISCVFSEPQFSSKTALLITEGSNARIGVLDPLGSKIKEGASLYFELMKNIASQFSQCLK